jgi:hypothetical protein
MKSPLTINIPFKGLVELKKIIAPASNISSFYLKNGVVEASLASSGHVVVAHTNKSHIFEFWSLLLRDPVYFSKAVEVVYNDFTVDQFFYFQSSWFLNKASQSRAIYYFILSCCSLYDTASKGPYNIKAITPFTFSKLSNFKIKNFYPLYDNCVNQLFAVNTAKKTDYILLPIGKYSLNLFEYGKNKGPEMYTFNHKEIHARVKDLDKKCILLYKNHPALFNLYKSFNIKMVDKYGRVADNKESCEDLIITNF